MRHPDAYSIDRMKHLIQTSIVVFVIASAAGCVVEDRGPRGRTVVEDREHGHGHGHAYGHEKKHER